MSDVMVNEESQKHRYDESMKGHEIHIHQSFAEEQQRKMEQHVQIP